MGIATSYGQSNAEQKRYAWIGIVSFGVGCAEPGYPGAYTRSGCFLGFIAEQFGLTAEFPFGNEHPSWSTDCPNGASRRSSATNRRKNRNQNRRKNKNKRKKGKDGLDRKNATETAELQDT